MTLGKSIRHGAAWLFGNTCSQRLTFLVGIVLARLLDPTDFGMLMTISIFTGIAGFISGGGMGSSPGTRQRSDKARLRHRIYPASSLVARTVICL